MKRKEDIKAVIFDCDGVMFDSRQANINFYNHILAHFGLPKMNEEEVEYVHMHTAEGSLRYIFRDTPYLEEALTYWGGMDYSPFVKDMVQEPGLKQLLTILKTDYGLAVATNRSNTIGPVLEWHGLAPFFDMVVSSLDVNRPKPDPEALMKILDFFEIAPKQACYVGDSLVDYETARAARVPLIAYKNRSLDAVFHADRMMDIAKKFLNISKGC